MLSAGTPRRTADRGHQQHQQQEAGSGTQITPQAKAAPPVQTGGQPGHYQPNCAQPYSSQDAQLCAEIRQADAAERTGDIAHHANWISAAAVLFSLISVVLVLIALWQNKKANEISAKGYASGRTEARQTAKTNVRVAELAEKALLTGERARMTVEQVKFGHGRDVNTGKMGLAYEVAWKNTGQTEATDVTIFTQHVIIGVDEVPNLAYEDAEKSPGGAVIGPGRTVFTPTFGVAVAKLDAVWRGESRMLIHSVAEYSDVFASDFGTPRRRTVYVGQIELPGPPSLIGTDAVYVVITRADMPGNEAT